MKKYFVLFFMLGTLAACDKGKFETKPQLSIKSVNTKEVPYNSTLVVTLEFTDKEGDVSDSLFILRERINQNFALSAPVIEYELPNFPNRNQGEIQVSFDFQTQLTNGLPTIPIPGTPTAKAPDSLVLKFWAKDKGGHFSDTVRLDGIIVERR